MARQGCALLVPGMTCPPLTPRALVTFRSVRARIRDVPLMATLRLVSRRYRSESQCNAVLDCPLGQQGRLCSRLRIYHTRPMRGTAPCPGRSISDPLLSYRSLYRSISSKARRSLLLGDTLTPGLHDAPSAFGRM